MVKVDRFGLLQVVEPEKIEALVSLFRVGARAILPISFGFLLPLLAFFMLLPLIGLMLVTLLSPKMTKEFWSWPVKFPKVSFLKVNHNFLLLWGWHSGSPVRVNLCPSQISRGLLFFAGSDDSSDFWTVEDLDHNDKTYNIIL